MLYQADETPLFTRLSMALKILLNQPFSWNTRFFFTADIVIAQYTLITTDRNRWPPIFLLISPTTMLHQTLPFFFFASICYLILILNIFCSYIQKLMLVHEHGHIVNGNNQFTIVYRLSLIVQYHLVWLMESIRLTIEIP